MATDNFCLYFQNTLIQTVKQEVNGKVILPPLVFPVLAFSMNACNVAFLNKQATMEGFLDLWDILG